MKICVIGAGHVGLVTAACFAEIGHRVICVDQDRKKLALLRKGKAWFYEPGLEKLVAKNVKQKRLSFTDRVAAGVKQSEILFIAVGTPPLPTWDADLTAVEQVVRQIAQHADGYRLIVEKSTVPVETGKRIKEALVILQRDKAPIEVASNPEFLREGSAVHDFFHPDRIVFGVESNRSKELLEKLYKPFKAPLVVTDIASAELIKHSSNAYLAMKISFINAVSVICDKVGADVQNVARGMGYDARIGPSFLNAGIGYGGFCFPKDLEAYIRIAEKRGYDFKLLKAVKEINEDQRRILVEKVTCLLWNLKGKKIGLLGLSFKPDTDDLRFAPALEIIAALREGGAQVHAYDPRAMPEAKRLLGPGIRLAKDPYHLAKDADCLILVTEWQEFKDLDLARIKKRMRQPVLVDGRNLYDPDKVKRLGFRYAAMGRSRDG